MSHEHLTEDQLLEAVYLDTASVTGCSVCSGRVAELDARRRTAAESLEVRPELLAVQRQAIYRRVEQRTWWPAPVAAALTAASMALLFLVPPPKPVQAPAPASISDEQLFADISSAMETSEPRAAAPIHALFEETNQ